MRALRKHRGRTFGASAALIVLVAVGAVLLLSGHGHKSTTLRNPIQRAQLTEFGARSHWLQPWRSYLTTPPASALRDAVGINFNPDPLDADAAARLIAASGFHRARVEWSWGDFAYGRPGELRDDGALQRLRALRRYGLRPLILLNANQGAPCPLRPWSAVLAEPAPGGARSVRLARDSARQVVPGRSGLNAPDGSKVAAVILTSVSPGGVARLSRPLPAALGAGSHPASTLQYAPFETPLRADGSPNPGFESTLRGWLSYVSHVTRQARALFGSDFDVEIWNELTFGSDFLYQDRYYAPPQQGQGDVTQALLARTVEWLRDPANGVPASVGVGDGFSNQTPFPSGATVPPGVTALDKHPYMDHVLRFPRDAVYDANRPLDALGRPDGAKRGGNWRDSFVPSYDAWLPEYWLTAIQTETMVHDVAPFTSVINGEPHGRTTHPKGRATPPEVWITETGMADDQGGTRLSAKEAARMHAKASLRALVAYASKGVAAIDLFAVKGDHYDLVDRGFFDRLHAGHAYPGDDAGGPTMTAVRRLVAAFEGPAEPAAPRPLSLPAIADAHAHKQFDGDGTRAHPPLYDRDVLAFFPFQASPTRYVAAVYVMTRNIVKPLAPETFRLTIGGLRPGAIAVSATDPLTGDSVAVKVVRRYGSQAVLQMQATDYPRILRIDAR